MNRPTPSLLDVQVNRANRRLFLQTLLNRLVACWTGALVVALLWFLVEPLLIDKPPDWLRWTIAGIVMGLGLVLAVVLAWLGAPSRLFAALSLDERFGLKERVTTSLSLTPQERESPAGQALLEDVRQRVGELDVPSRFPVRLSWLASAIPLAAAVLILVALFYDPMLTPANARKGDPLKQPPTNPAEIAQNMDKLKRNFQQLQKEELPKSEKLKEIEAEMEKIANRPRETREQVRERIKEMTALEDKVRDHQKQLADKSNTLKKQLQELNRQSEKNQLDGPANDLQKALADGDLKKAKDEMEKLAKKLADDKLTDKEKEQLQKQMENLQNKAEKMAKEQQEREQKLEKLIKEAKAEGRDAEALQRELDRVRQEGKNMQKLQDLAQKLGQCKQCMAQGDMNEAAKQLQEAGQQLKELNLSEEEMKQLQDQLQRLQDAKGACCKGDKQGDKQGDKDGEGGEGKGSGEGDGFAQNNGAPGSNDPATGRRPKGKEGNFKSFDARQKADFDPSKKMYLDGFAPGQNFKAKTAPEVAGDIKQAAQEAPDAIEHQPIPKAKRDIAKDYYRNLGGQAEKK
jgi:uncharacterized coiled-coil DUF342 family protein